MVMQKVKCSGIKNSVVKAGEIHNKDLGIEAASLCLHKNRKAHVSRGKVGRKVKTSE